MPELHTRVGQPSQTLKDKLVLKVIDFVHSKLSVWRDNPGRPEEEAEEKLNEQLCIFLQDEARSSEQPFVFLNEKFQSGRRRIDIAANPTGKTVKAGVYDSIFTPITVIEAKRLPAPSKAREKEYLTGEESGKTSGGIQRYKLCLHGAQHEIAAIVGYIQDYNSYFFSNQLNLWIEELAKESTNSWSTDELLAPIKMNIKTRTSRTESRHMRVSGSKILIHHLWVEMKSK